MNFAIAKAMLLEQFRRTLPILVLCLGVTTVFCLIQYTMTSVADVYVHSTILNITIFLVHALGFIALLYCYSDERDLKMTMPVYLFRLPVRTIDLVIWRMSYGLFCVAVVSIGSASVYYFFFGAAVAFTFWTPFQIGITTFAILQALAWSIGVSGILKLLFACWIIFMVAASLGFEPHFKYIESDRSTTEFMLLTLGVSFLVANIGLRMRRSERFDFSGILAALPSLFVRHRCADLPPFTSPEKAMRWFEWRRQCRMLPVLVCGFSIFLMINILSDMKLQNPSGSLVAYGEMGIAICVLTLGLTTTMFGAYCLFQNQRLQFGPQKNFLFIRPVSTKAIANARLVVALRSVVFSMIPLIVLCTVAIFLVSRSGTGANPSELQRFVDNHLGLSDTFFALLLLLGMFAITWSVFWIGNLIAQFAVFGVVSMILLAVFGNDYTRIDETAKGVTGLVMIAACAMAGYIAYRRDLLEKKSLYCAISIWPLLAVGFSTWLHWEQFVHDGGISYELLLRNSGNVFGFAGLPLAPLVAVPLFMHYARHS